MRRYIVLHIDVETEVFEKNQVARVCEGGIVTKPAALSKEELLAALDEMDPEWLGEVTGQPGAKRAKRAKLD